MTRKKKQPADLVSALSNQAAEKRFSVRIEGEAREFMEAVLAHNDDKPKTLKIPMEQAIKTLKDEYGVEIGATTLRRWCTSELGRRSWARP